MQHGLYSSVAERQSCKLKVLGSIPSGGFSLEFVINESDPRSLAQQISSEGPAFSSEGPSCPRCISDLTGCGEPVLFMQLSTIVVLGDIEVGSSFNYPDKRKRAHPDLNQVPADLQSAALTTELCTQMSP